MSRIRSPRILEKSVFPCPATTREQPVWHGAMRILADKLPEFFSGKSEATVVLSNHFVRYGIFHNAPNVTRSDEELALLQHQFSRIYGNVTSQWQYNLSTAEGFDTPRVACAVDKALLDSLHDSFQQHKTVIRSVQPYLMNVFNRYRNRINQTCWLAVMEEEILCLVRIKSGRWQSIKTHRIDADWRRELVTLIDREKLLSAHSSSQEKSPEPVLVFAPEYLEPINVAPNHSRDTEIDEIPATVLDPSLWPEPSIATNATYAMAIIG